MKVRAVYITQDEHGRSYLPRASGCDDLRVGGSVGLSRRACAESTERQIAFSGIFSRARDPAGGGDVAESSFGVLVAVKASGARIIKTAKALYS